MTDNFADTPRTITEIKAERAHDGTLWTARDVVVAWLRDYDKGKIKDCNTVLLIYDHKEEDDKASVTSFYQRSRSTIELLGTVSKVQHLIARGSCEH